MAKAINVPPNRIHAIVNGKRSITADTDLRLCKFFKLSDGYFLRLQNLYETAEAKNKLTDKLKLIKPFDEFMKKNCSDIKLFIIRNSRLLLQTAIFLHIIFYHAKLQCLYRLWQ